MHNSNTNNHLFLKALLLFFIVFALTASSDFKTRSNLDTTSDTSLSLKLNQATNGVLVSLPELPPFKAKCSFGVENDFLFKNLEILKEAYKARVTKKRLKLLTNSYLNLKKRLKIQSFSTSFHQEYTGPGHTSA